MLFDGKVVGLHVIDKLKTEYPNADFSLQTTVIELNEIFREYVLQILRNFIEKLVELELHNYMLFTTLQEEAINFKNNAIACFKLFIDNFDDIESNGILKRTIANEEHMFNNFAKEQAENLDLGGMISSILNGREFLVTNPEEVENYLKIIYSKINPLIIDMNTDCAYVYNEFLNFAYDSIKKQQEAGSRVGFFIADYMHNLLYFFHIIAYALWQTSFKKLNCCYDVDLRPWISIADPIAVPKASREKHINIKL